MEPVTATAIISAITAGAAAIAQNITNKGVSDAYEALKSLLKKKFGEQSEIIQTVSKLERKPESKGQQMLLHEDISEAKVDENTEVRELVQRLMDELQQSSPSQHIEQHATGDGNIQIQGSGNVTINT